MGQIWSRFAAPAIVVAVLTGVTAPALAAASAKPSATFSFTQRRVNQKAPLHINYSTAHLPAGSSVYLQRQASTGHVWKNVKRLRAGSGTASADGVPMGLWGYRIRVVSHRSTVVTSRMRPLYSYGTVSYLKLCQVWRANKKIYKYPCFKRKLEFAGKYFIANWVIHGRGYKTILKYHSTSCRSLAIQYADDDLYTSGDSEYIRLVQSGSPEKNSSGLVDQINTFKVGLNGHSFVLSAAEDNSSTNTYVGGSASCYTSNGKP